MIRLSWKERAVFYPRQAFGRLCNLLETCRYRVSRDRRHHAQVALLGLKWLKRRRMTRLQGGVPGDDAQGRRYAGSYRAVRKALFAIPAEGLQGKIVLDLFGGHGAYGFMLASGLRSDARPARVLVSDLSYGDENGIDIRADWAHWVALQKSYAVDERRVDRPAFFSADAARIPLGDARIDTVFLDPPYGYLCRIDTSAPEFLETCLGEVFRVLKAGGRCYCTLPRAWLDLPQWQARPYRLLKGNIGLAWFDISLVEIAVPG